MVMTSTATTVPTSPCHDDVLIAFKKGRWEVGIASTPPSISCASRDAAMKVARAFSTLHHVDIWLSDGAALQRVSVHTSAGDAVRR